MTFATLYRNGKLQMIDLNSYALTTDQVSSLVASTAPAAYDGECSPCEARAKEALRRGRKNSGALKDFRNAQMFTDEVSTAPAPVTWEGVIGIEGELTGDGRFISPGALRWDALPIPLRYVSQDVGAHQGAQVVGRINTIERMEDGTIWATGDYDMGSEVGREAARVCGADLMRGVSMDLDDVSFEVRIASDASALGLQDVATKMAEGTPDADGRIKVQEMAPDDEVMVTTSARVRAATQVAVPAFSRAQISLTADSLVAAGVQTFGYNEGQWRNPDNGQWIDMPDIALGKFFDQAGMDDEEERALQEEFKAARESGTKIEGDKLQEARDILQGASMGMSPDEQDTHEEQLDKTLAALDAYETHYVASEQSDLTQEQDTDIGSKDSDTEFDDMVEMIKTEARAGSSPDDWERGDPMRTALIAVKNGRTYEEAAERALGRKRKGAAENKSDVGDLSDADEKAAQKRAAEGDPGYDLENKAVDLAEVPAKIREGAANGTSKRRSQAAAVAKNYEKYYISKLTGDPENDRKIISKLVVDAEARGYVGNEISVELFKDLAAQAGLDSREAILDAVVEKYSWPEDTAESKEATKASGRYDSTVDRIMGYLELGSIEDQPLEPHSDDNEYLNDGNSQPDFEFAPPRVWKENSGPINDFLAGKGSAEDAKAALDAYSQDIWGTDAEPITQAEIEDETSARADAWNELLAKIEAALEDDLSAPSQEPGDGLLPGGIQPGDKVQLEDGTIAYVSEVDAAKGEVIVDIANEDGSAPTGPGGSRPVDAASIVAKSEDGVWNSRDGGSRPDQGFPEATAANEPEISKDAQYPWDDPKWDAWRKGLSDEELSKAQEGIDTTESSAARNRYNGLVAERRLRSLDKPLEALPAPELPSSQSDAEKKFQEELKIAGKGRVGNYTKYLEADPVYLADSINRVFNGTWEDTSSAGNADKIRQTFLNGQIDLNIPGLGQMSLMQHDDGTWSAHAYSIGGGEGRPESYPEASDKSPAVAIQKVLESLGENDSLQAAAAPVDPDAPPAAHFSNPNLKEPTPLRVDADGRVYGHLATWGACHLSHTSAGKCVTPPRSKAGYAYFNTGSVVTREGSEFGVGQITLNTGHATSELRPAATLAHYDNTGLAVADITVGEDAHGIWFSGSLRPGVSAASVRVLRASPLSGDWRRIGTNLELVAALAVNVQGYAVPRPKGQVRNGTMQSLVAAGMLAPKTVSRKNVESGALSVEDIKYLKALAARERMQQEQEKFTTLSAADELARTMRNTERQQTMAIARKIKAQLLAAAVSETITPS